MCHASTSKTHTHSYTYTVLESQFSQLVEQVRLFLVESSGTMVREETAVLSIAYIRESRLERDYGTSVCGKKEIKFMMYTDDTVGYIIEPKKNGCRDSIKERTSTPFASVPRQNLPPIPHLPPSPFAPYGP